MTTHKHAFQYFLQKERKLITVGLLLTAVAILYNLLFAYVPMYKGLVHLYIRNIPRENVLADYGGGDTDHSESGYSNPLFNQMEILNSELLSSQVYPLLRAKYKKDVDTLLPVSRKETLTQIHSGWHNVFSKLVKATVIPSTDVLRIQMMWDNKDHASSVFNTILKAYQDLNISIRRSTQTAHREYLDAQLSKITAQLDDVRKKIHDYRLQNKAIDLTNESTELTRARVDLEKQAQVLRSTLSSSQARMHDLSTQLGVKNGTSALRATGVGADPYLVKLNQDLADARSADAQLSAKLTPLHPDRQATVSRINAITRAIAQRQQETTGKNGANKGLYDPASVNVATEMSRAQADSRSQSSQLATLETGIQNLNAQEQELPGKQLGLDELQKQEDALKSAYDNIIQKQMEAHIKENLVDNNIIVLDQSTQPSLSLSQPVVMVLSIFLFGSLLTLALAWFKQSAQDRWLNAEEIEDVTGQRILGTLPWMPQYRPAENPLVSSQSRFGAAYSHIVSSLISRSYQEGSQIISFLSTTPSHSISPIVLNIADNLARSNKSVILIDTCHSPRERVARTFAPHFSPQADQLDLVDIINTINMEIRVSGSVSSSQVQQYIEKALIYGEDGFAYLTPHKADINVSHYIASRGFQEILAVLKDRFEFILLDTPSQPSLTPEVQPIIELSDATVIIAGIHSRRQDLMAMISEYSLEHHKVLGIISRERKSWEAVPISASTRREVAKQA